METAPSGVTSEADVVRDTERKRIRALVSANMEVARQLHADDFQLITPLGAAFSKEQFLGAVAAGQINYLSWECGSTVEVRMYSEVAVIRYQSQIEIIVEGQKYPRGRYWHTDVTKSVIAVGRPSGPTRRESHSDRNNPSRSLLCVNWAANDLSSLIPFGLEFRRMNPGCNEDLDRFPLRENLSQA